MHQLRATLENAFAREGRTPPLTATVMSFGFKYGLPLDADLVVDARFLPNPHWVPELRPHTGQDGDVRDYVLGQPDAASSSTGTPTCSGCSSPATGARASGTSRSPGCTGGKHRSVAIAEEFARRCPPRASPPLPVTATWAASSGPGGWTGDRSAAGGRVRRGTRARRRAGGLARLTPS